MAAPRRQLPEWSTSATGPKSYWRPARPGSTTPAGAVGPPGPSGRRRRPGPSRRRPTADRQAVAAELDLRERLGALAEHLQRRQQRIADVPPRSSSTPRWSRSTPPWTAPARPGRHARRRPASTPGAPDRTGADYPCRKGRWCHHALQIEGVLDRNDGRNPASSGSVQKPTGPDSKSPWPTAYSKPERPARAQRMGRTRRTSRDRPRPGPSGPTQPRRQTAHPRPMASSAAMDRSCCPTTSAGHQHVAEGDFARVGCHHRSPCQRHRRRDGSADRVRAERIRTAWVLMTMRSGFYGTFSNRASR